MAFQVFSPSTPLVELHSHLGGGVDAATMWELAHEQGIKVPYSDYFEFAGATNIATGTDGLDGLNKVYHFTELIQSSPEGVQRSVYQMLALGYRSQRINKHEVRFNPAKRNRGGERDLDAIIMAAVHGLDRAQIDYGIEAGLILMMDRQFPMQLNEAIVERAIKFSDRGVIGIDIGGPRARHDITYDYAGLADIVREAKRAGGLGVTIHAGEEGYALDDDSLYMQEFHDVLDLAPDRIGHGIIASKHTGVMKDLAAMDIMLEVCPTSNMRTGAILDYDQASDIVANLLHHGVKVALCTDGPEMIGTTLRQEYDLLVGMGAITTEDAAEMQGWARDKSFIGDRHEQKGNGSKD